MTTATSMENLQDVMRMYFELSAIQNDFKHLEGNGSLQFAIDSNVIAFCENPQLPSHISMVSPLIEDKDELCSLYALQLSALLTGGPNSSIDDIEKNYVIFPSHLPEFERRRLLAIDDFDHSVRAGIDETSPESTKAISVIVKSMQEKFTKDIDITVDFSRLREQFPSILKIATGEALGPLDVLIRFEHRRALDINLHSRDISLRGHDITERTSAMIRRFMDTSDKSAGAALADTDTIRRLISYNLKRDEGGSKKRLVLLTMDQSLLALRHAITVAPLTIKGRPLAEFCCIRDARLAPFMPGFERFAHGDGESSRTLEPIAEFLADLAPIAALLEDVADLCIKGLWLQDNEPRRTLLTESFCIPARTSAGLEAKLSALDESTLHIMIADARNHLANAFKFITLAGQGSRRGDASKLHCLVDVFCEPKVEEMFRKLTERTIEDAVKLIRQAKIGKDGLLNIAVQVWQSTLQKQTRARRLPVLLLSKTSQYFNQLMELGNGRGFSLSAILANPKLGQVETSLAIAYLMASVGQWDRARHQCEKILATECDVENGVEARIMAAVAIRLSGRKDRPELYLSDMERALGYLDMCSELLRTRNPAEPNVRLLWIGIEMERAVNSIFAHNHLRFVMGRDPVTTSPTIFISHEAVIERLSRLADELQFGLDTGMWPGASHDRVTSLLRNVHLNICSEAWLAHFAMAVGSTRSTDAARRSLDILESLETKAHFEPSKSSYADCAIMLMARWWLNEAGEYNTIDGAVGLRKILDDKRKDMLHYEEAKYLECIDIMESGRDSIL